MSKHSPLPWRIDKADPNNPLSAIRDLRWISGFTGDRVASMLKEANAEFIVHSVNLMPKIEAFLERVLNYKIPDDRLVSIENEAESLLGEIRGKSEEDYHLQKKIDYLKCLACGLIAVDPNTMRCVECDADHRGGTE